MSFCTLFAQFNPDFPLGLEMTTQNILMDFLWKFEGNSHSIDRKFAQERRKMIKLAFK
jgi:hypothetical protein